MDHVGYRMALRETVGLSGLPFDQAEYGRRRLALLTGMEAAGVDAMLITNPSDIYYLCGYSTFEVSVHACLVFHRDRLILQVPSIETGPAVTGSLVDEVVGYRWEEPRAVIDQLVDALGTAGTGGTVGLDRWSATLRSGIDVELCRRAAGFRFVDVSGLVDGLRVVKSPAELEYLRRSARVTELGLDAAAAEAHAGTTDSAVAAAGSHAMLAAGSEFMSMQPIVVAGRRSSIIHTNHRRCTIEAGDPVFLEFGAAWHRYTAPMMRTVVAGRPSPAMEDMLGIVRRIYEALVERMRPGYTFHDAAAAADAALAPVVDEVFFSGVWGYAVGAQFPPSWVEESAYLCCGDETEFVENMVFHLPLCLRVPGRWGIGMSETVLVTSQGGEPLTRNTWHLQAG